MLKHSHSTLEVRQDLGHVLEETVVICKVLSKQVVLQNHQTTIGNVYPGIYHSGPVRVQTYSTWGKKT
jgi:hypothetical protein